MLVVVIVVTTAAAMLAVFVVVIVMMVMVMVMVMIVLVVMLMVMVVVVVVTAALMTVIGLTHLTAHLLHCGGEGVGAADGVHKLLAAELIPRRADDGCVGVELS